MRSTYHIAVVVLLGFLVAAGVSAAQGGPVDFQEETHFRCYIVSQQTPEPEEAVTLTDQFLKNVTLTVDEPLQFCVPTSKNRAEIEQPEEHLTMYRAPQELVPHLTVFTEDQFGLRR